MARKTLTVGVDEAGRGPLAGPVVCSAVAFPEGIEFPNDVVITDSKRLTPKRRRSAFEFITHNLYWSVVVVDVYTIDRLNIRRATLSGMAKALESLIEKYPIVRDYRIEVVVDGRDGIPLPEDLDSVCVPTVKADSSVLQVSCASILAKVVRDGIMLGLDVLYPQYGFARHKGYATEDHIRAINQYGPSRVHRRSYDPVVQMRLW